MTLGSFVVRNTFRNKRRSLLTMISISFSLLLLTLMICIWRSFYVDQVAPEASRRVDYPRPRLAGVFSARRSTATRFAACPRRDGGGADHLVRRPLHRRPAGTFFRSTGHRSGRVSESSVGQDSSRRIN